MRRGTLGAIFGAAAMAVSLPLAAQTEIDLSTFAADHRLDGAAGDKLGGIFLADTYVTYWDTPTDGDQDTGHGPASVRGAVSCDFDGDGFLDLAIGAPARSASAGGVYLFYGRPDQMLAATIALSTATNYDVVYTGDANSDFGNQVVAGDVNGDGFCDLFVNAPERSNNQGAVYLLLGGARAAGTLFPPGPGATVNAGASYSIRTSDNESFDVVSYSVAVGDVSGDGVADVIVGALYDDSAVSKRDTGSVNVYFGKSTMTRANTSGLNIDLDTVSSGGASMAGYNVRYWGATGYGILAFEGPADNLGAAVAAVDLDGDGVKDVVMGAPSPQLDYSASGTNDTGSVYVVLGGGAPSGTGTVNLGSGSISLANAGSYHIRFNNVQNWAHFGAAIAGGDLVGDAAEDLLVAAPFGWFNFVAGNESGSVYLVAGSTTWQGMSRNNTQIDLVAPGNGYAYRFDGAALGDELRAVAVADMDHDGSADILLGSPRADPSGRSEAGAAYYFAGPWSGSGTVNLGAVTPPYDERISGAAAGDRAGLMVAAVDYPCGTVRRVVAAPYSSSSAGKVYVMPPLNPPLATTLRLVGGNAQVGTPGQPLTDPIEVEVVAASGRPIGCRQVAFTAGNGGSVGTATVYTWVNGVAKTTWTLGPGAGNQSASATVSGLAGSPLTFSACAAIAADDASCDNVDDDCDGTADEDFVALPTTCGVGACVRSGTLTCVAGIPQDSCVPGTAAASDATCDAIDDDCSGVADEDYGSQPTTCGVGACARVGVRTCVGGSPQDSCVPGAPAADDATCDNVDDDCSGAADEDYAPQQSNCGVGACARTGHRICLAGVPTNNCDPGAPAANDATCDNIDDDCSGAADEDYVATPTQCGVGACARTGLRICVSGTATDNCAPGAPAAADATCDNIDDDCSGAADEDYVAQPTTCGVGVCQRSGGTTCVSGTVTTTQCQAGNPIGADDTCDGVDDDCDGTADEHFVAHGTSCGVGSCAANGDATCVNHVLVDSCTPLAGAADDATCDSVDDDCDGTADDDYVVDSTCGVGYCRDHNVPGRCQSGAETPCLPATPPRSDDPTCDGVDDDCDGSTDEDVVAGSACDDGTTDACTIGVCSPTTHRCESSRRSNCCLSGDAECTAPGRCLVGRCDPAGHACNFEATAGCCTSVSDCDDGDACTVESCGSGTCASERLFGCCSSNADCDDGDPCSYDQCTQFSRCLYSPGACATSGPCGGDQACLYSGVLIGRSAHSPMGAVVRDGATQPVLQIVATTAALGGNLASLRLRLDGLSGVVASSEALTAHLFDDLDDDGLIGARQTPLATARSLDLASGAIVFEEMQVPLAPATSRHLLVALRRNAAAGGCSAADLHALGPSWLGLFALLWMRRRPRWRTRSLLLAAAIALAALAACARTGYLEVHRATVAIEQNADLMVVGGGNERLVVQGAPIASAPFQVIF